MLSGSFIPLFDASIYSSDEVESALLALENVVSLMKKSGVPLKDLIWFSESKFILDNHLQLGGTVDFIWAYRDKKTKKKICHIWDYKNGATPVDAEVTLQLALYACAVQHEFGAEQPFDEFYTYIFQPNSSDQTKTFTEKKFTRKEVKQLTEEFFTIAHRALGYEGDGALKLKAGDHCKFCSAKGACPEYLKPAQEKALALMGKPVAAKVEPKEFVKALSDEQLVSLLSHADYIEDCLSAVRDYIKQRNLTGRIVAGTKCVYGQSKTTWNDDLIEPQEIGKQLLYRGVVSPFNEKLKSISDVKKVLKEVGFEKDKIEEILKPLTTKTTPPIKVVLAEEQGEEVETVQHQKAIELMS